MLTAGHKMKEEVMDGKSKRKHSRSEMVPISPKKEKESKQNCDEKVASGRIKKEDHALDRKVFFYEEELASSADPKTDLNEFRKTCNNIAGLVSEINKLKKDEGSEEHPGIAEKRSNALLLTTSLKKFNRLTQIRGKDARESTLEVKSKVDGMQLALQNLLYEVMRMKKEIEKCMNFSSKDEEIDLVPVEKFYQDAPAGVSKPDVTKTDKHKQMLARLAWELKTRKELSTKKGEFVQEKKRIESEIEEKSDYLVNLRPRLEQIIKATLPVQEFMGMPIEAERLIFEKAQYLPRPLYVLYIQAKAFKDVCDDGLSVGIEGDVIEAKAEFYSEDVKADFSDDSDNEQNDGQEDQEQKRGRKSKVEDEQLRLEDQQKRLFRIHPLQVTIQMSKEKEYIIDLVFSHVPSLHITVVKVQITLEEERESLSSNSLLEASVILKDLLSSDTGKSSPNPSNKYQFTKLGINNFYEHISPVGLPYQWVQWICGMNFLPDEDVQYPLPNSVLSAKHFQSVIKTIKTRLNARLSLVKQLQSLEQLSIPTFQRKSSANLVPEKMLTLLTAWKPVPYEECLSFPSFRDLLREGMASEDVTCFTATFTREESLQCLIIIHEHYPEHPPLLLLSMEGGSTDVDMMPRLFCLEREINAFVDELMTQDDKNMLLSGMLRKLQVCFDMFVETSEQHTSKDRLYIRKTCGRDRNRPYKYLKDGYFVHR